MRRLPARLVVVASLGVFVAGPGLPDLVRSRGAETPSPDALWLTPGPVSTPALGGALRALADGDLAFARESFAHASADPAVGWHARLYQGRAELAIGDITAAIASAEAVRDRTDSASLRGEALWLLGDGLERAGRWSEATDTWAMLAAMSADRLAAVRLRLGRAALQAGRQTEALAALSALYYEVPGTSEAREAEQELTSRFVWPPADEPVARALERADRLFAGRHYELAKREYGEIAARVPEAERTRVRLRLVQCDLQLGHAAAAHEALRGSWEAAGPLAEEVEFARLAAVRRLQRADEYASLVAAFVERYAPSSLAEAALNDLATFHILADRDAEAAAVFSEMLQRYPGGAFAERAAWKAGWAAFRARDYRGAIDRFEPAAGRFPRSDYRPAWLYWSAQAHARLGDRPAAAAGFRQTVSFYRNSYYGRQAISALGSSSAAARGPASAEIQAGDAPPNAPLIRALLAAELYDDAMAEIRSAQARADTPQLQATLAYALNRKGDLRAGITAMRRAYPQFMADGGEALPVDVLQVIFPLQYRELIQDHATRHRLDPFLMAALIAQESTFRADVRSPANAWGLMQILPATGQRVARAVGVRSFSTAMLTDPDVNVRIGMRYFSDLLARFDGDAAAALAAYNAGENRVARWRAERPGIPTDEFIDDIPFPETQHYVKRILGTAEDYRVLYGGAGQEVVRQSRP